MTGSGRVCRQCDPRMTRALKFLQNEREALSRRLSRSGLATDGLLADKIADRAVDAVARRLRSSDTPDSLCQATWNKAKSIAAKERKRAGGDAAPLSLPDDDILEAATAGPREIAEGNEFIAWVSPLLSGVAEPIRLTLVAVLLGPASERDIEALRRPPGPNCAGLPRATLKRLKRAVLDNPVLSELARAWWAKAMARSAHEAAMRRISRKPLVEARREA